MTLLKSFGLGRRIAPAAALAVGFALSAQAGDVTNDVNFAADTVYQIVTDRFVDGDAANNPSGDLFSSDCSKLRKYCGGDWAGIVQKIQDGYLTEMGITALWISQPVENIFAVTPDAEGATSYHGFWARDYKRTNPYFGSMTDFETLISVAHANGIKVIIDFTPNHSSPSRETDSSYMEDGAVYDDGTLLGALNNDPLGLFFRNGGTDFSTYEDGMYRSLFDLADYNQQTPELDAYMKDAIKLWLDKGVDGLRVDAVKHFPPGWAQVWMDAIYAHRPVFTFGEWFLSENEVDPLYYDFANESGMSLLDFRFGQQIREVLRDGTDDWAGFDAMIAETAAEHDEVIDQLTFIDNHDMPRFHVSGADRRRTDMALAVTLASRGTPIVYYGTEQYMTGTGDPTNRQMMTAFDRTTRGYKIVKALAPLRQSNPALAYGDTQERWINNDVYIFEREFGDSVVLVAVNRAGSGSTDITGLFTALPQGSYGDALGGLLDGNAITVNADGSANAFALAGGEVGVWAYAGFGAAPAIGHVGPMMARAGQTVTIDGEGFGASAGTVRFGSGSAGIVSWSDTRIEAQVPAMAAGFYDIVVEPGGGGASNAYDRFEILSGPQVSVRFIVDNATTSVGTNVYLTGSVHELSNWSTAPDAAIGPFFNQVVHGYPSWYYDVSVPAGQTIQFKFVKIDGAGNVTWEGGSNHSFTAPSSGTAEVRVGWQD